jgi:hypothetical protein
MSFAKQTYPSFCFEPLNGSAHNINNPSSNTPSKEGVDLYYQHRSVNDGIRGKLNVAMSTTLSELKDPSMPLRKYLLNKEKIYITQASLGLVDARIIGVMLHTNPQLTFRDDIKVSISDIMRDGTPPPEELEKSTHIPTLLDILIASLYKLPPHRETHQIYEICE